MATMKLRSAIVLLWAIAWDFPAAFAAELGLKIPAKAASSAVFDWTGFYLGGHAGYGSGSFGPGTHPLPLQGALFPPSITGMIGGYQAGYNYQLANRVVLGAEADVSFGSPTTATSRPACRSRAVSGEGPTTPSGLAAQLTGCPALTGTFWPPVGLVFSSATAD